MAEPEILTQQQHGEDERDGTAAETKDSRDIQPTVSQEEKEDPDAFVNNGLIKWQTARDSWCQKPKGSDASSKEKQKAIPIDVDGIIDVLFDPPLEGRGESQGISRAAALSEKRSAPADDRCPDGPVGGRGPGRVELYFGATMEGIGVNCDELRMALSLEWQRKMVHETKKSQPSGW
eukprot:CAMPEP_0116102940 /NCGR_PEP_ID=MMETSP0327-20121206/13620_1 /TAXON_ID=44447 /ORGANISM="Pseudo-nitzschia delicatissima, Strain B596" /LENGTH=176 /DNA_ID=CAMNT_0003595019 /DNA_START=304 /DNA_END=830 /DNA_ORIENTATION=-